MNLNKKLKKGFSLVEMLVVVAIIGILSTVLYTSYTKYITSSKKSVVQAEMLQIVEVFETAMVANKGTGRSVDDEVSMDNFYTYDELFTLEEGAEEIYTTITGSALPNTASLEFDAENKTIVYTNRGMEITYNPKTQTFTNPREV